ncbi:transposable element tcb1 transposase [Trichonephila clavipes]|nr:transposable element tcb1 transposase [Trichonephila clavipes]
MEFSHVCWRPFVAIRGKRLGTSHSAARLTWYKALRHRAIAEWKQFLRSYESRFGVYQFDVRVWVWNMPGKRLLPECIMPTVKYGGGGIIVWGCLIQIYGISSTPTPTPLF